MTIKPREPAPRTRGHVARRQYLASPRRKAGHVRVIVVYRGLHCPVCKTYLADLETKFAGNSPSGC